MTRVNSQFTLTFDDLEIVLLHSLKATGDYQTTRESGIIDTLPFLFSDRSENLQPCINCELITSNGRCLSSSHLVLLLLFLI